MVRRASSSPVGSTDSSKPAAPNIQSAPDPVPDPVPGSGAVDDGLTVAQRNALTQLASGRSIKVAANRVGVHRNTVHRWLRGDPAFRAAYSAWIAEVQESAYARLLSLVDPAVTTLGHAINKRNLQASLALLRNLSAFKSPAPGPEDADECRRLTRVEREQREATLMENENDACKRQIHASMSRPYGLEKEIREGRASSSRQLANPTPGADRKGENPSASPPTQKETEALMRALDNEDLEEDEDDLEDQEDLDEEEDLEEEDPDEKE